MKTAVALMVSALVLGLAMASCGCGSGNSGRSVCGGGCSSGPKVRPVFIPPPTPMTVVRKYVTVVEQEQPAPCNDYVPAPQPQPARCSSYMPAPQPAQRAVYCEEREAAPAPIPVAYNLPRILVRPAPQPQWPQPTQVCNSCRRPSSSCGCN